MSENGKTWNPATVFDLFGDALCRQILVLANESPITAKELAERTGVSPPTVYRRTDKLVDHDFLTQRRRVDGNGNHYRTFETTLRRVKFEIEGDGYTVDVQLRQGLVDSFEAFWSELDSGRTGTRADASSGIDVVDTNSDSSPT